ncbi:MAG: bax protein (hydrolyses peptidoglycan), partial [Rhodobacteraceae bacterium]
EGNAFFGERTYDDGAPGLIPVSLNASATPFKVKSFSSGRLSVRSFMKTLNTHAAYRAFRQQRAALRAEGVYPTGLGLAPFLHGYSEIGDLYIQRIVGTIYAGDLNAYDDLRLANESGL